jgi:hypothetical protein
MCSGQTELWCSYFETNAFEEPTSVHPLNNLTRMEMIQCVNTLKRTKI